MPEVFWGNSTKPVELTEAKEVGRGSGGWLQFRASELYC